METVEHNAQCSSQNIFIQTSVKQEPVFDDEIDFEQNINKNDQTIKAEPQDGSDGPHAAMYDSYGDQDVSVKLEVDGSDGPHATMYDSYGDQDLSVKLEVGDPEAAGRGVDGGLRGRLREEEQDTSPHPNGN